MEIDGPRYAVISDGVLVARRESLSLALEALEGEIDRGEFLEVKLVNTRLMQHVQGFVDEQLKREIEEVRDENERIGGAGSVAALQRDAQHRGYPEACRCVGGHSSEGCQPYCASDEEFAAAG